MQLRHPTMRGGANAESLVEYQQRSIERWPLSVNALEGCGRDPAWRPYASADARIDDTGAPRSGKEYFDAAVQHAPPYYWRR